MKPSGFSDMTATVEYIDHTGDTGILVTADTPQQVFTTAAKCMFHIICPSKACHHNLSYAIKLQGQGFEQLLVDWLSELNFLFQTESFLLAEVNDFLIRDNTLTARVSGEKLDTTLHNIHTEIKAVTWHNLYLKPVNGKWQAQVIFDI